MKADDPRHGRNAGYVAGCRSECCQRAHMRWTKAYRMDRAPRRLPILGVRRRVEALRTLGYSMAEQSRLLGHADRTYLRKLLTNNKGHVMRRTFDDIDALYRRLCMTPHLDHPERCRGWNGSRERTRREALAKGCAPPLAWDDIDDPNEQPQGIDSAPVDLDAARRRQQETPHDVDPGTVERLMAGETVPATRAERLEVLRRWVADGGSQNALERMHGWNVQRDLRRARANDNDDGKAA